LPRPFIVMATQNPLDMAGTHPLPESQLDRFLVSMSMGYPGPEIERALLSGQGSRLSYSDLQAIMDAETLQLWQRRCHRVHLSEPVLDYIQSLILATRTHADIKLGLSPRGAQGLTRLAQAWALLARREYVQPDDVQSVFLATVQHRLQPVQGKTGRQVAEHVLADTPMGV
ncbi:MAG: MoxR family ATPase, partial [Natronospirillum sp.]